MSGPDVVKRGFQQEGMRPPTSLALVRKTTSQKIVVTP
jgi:hypothetical protein